MTKNGMRPVHPGEILKEEYLEPLSLTAAALARALRVSTPTVNDIVLQRRGVSADMALRLSICLDTTPEFWLNLHRLTICAKPRLNEGLRFGIRLSVFHIAPDPLLLNEPHVTNVGFFCRSDCQEYSGSTLPPRRNDCTLWPFTFCQHVRNILQPNPRLVIPVQQTPGRPEDLPRTTAMTRCGGSKPAIGWS
jgi:addiction module HigA family antidote